MAYLKRIVCLANSYKKNGRCIAGREMVGDRLGGWIRAVSERPTAEVWAREYKYENDAIPKPLDIIDIPLSSPDPRQHQTENHVIDPSRRWAKVGELPWAALAQIRDRPATLWINSGRARGRNFSNISRTQAATLQDSLALIEPDNFAVQVCRNYFTRSWEYRGVFDYNGVHHNLSMTDPIATAVFREKGQGRYLLNNLYLCLSLTEPDAKDRCHKLVAAILSDPPLLADIVQFHIFKLGTLAEAA